MCHSIILKHQVPLAWAAGTMAPTKGSAGGCEGDSGPEKLQPSSAHLAQTLLNSLCTCVATGVQLCNLVAAQHWDSFMLHIPGQPVCTLVGLFQSTGRALAIVGFQGGGTGPKWV